MTTGRFHVLDLARELDRLGCRVAFWTIAPRGHLRRYGLPDACYRGLLARLLPLVLLQRWGGPRLDAWATPLLLRAVDRLVARRLEPCDVFIGMSGLTLEAAQAARARFGAKIVLERGSRHVLSQQEILAALPQEPARALPDWAVERELEGYRLADLIAVPSHHVAQSFIERGIPAQCLFVDPYGVDSDMFKPTPCPDFDPVTILYVGNWTLQKGCDILVDAWRRLHGVRLLHVGPLGDAPLPTEVGFEHRDAIPQWRLPEVYAQAHVFALASRQDGLALVQAQALACGLALVCTSRTGGEDLARLLSCEDAIRIIPPDNSEALGRALGESVAWVAKRFAPGQTRDILGAARPRISWARYGEAYAARLARLVSDER